MTGSYVTTLSENNSIQHNSMLSYTKPIITPRFCMPYIHLCHVFFVSPVDNCPFGHCATRYINIYNSVRVRGPKLSSHPLRQPWAIRSPNS